MLRITKTSERSPQVTLKIEGQIAGKWAAEFEKECLRWLGRGSAVVLDFSEVSFVSTEAVTILRRLLSMKLEILNYSRLISDLLKNGSEE